MPMPKPKKNESQDDFISRCMSFLDNEDSDLDQDQRLAACFSAWRERQSSFFEIEPRDYKASFEVRFDKDKRPIIVGYAALFDSLSVDLGGFKEKIAPGAFKRSLRSKQDTYLFWNHNSDKVLGRKAAKTLKLTEDEKGLRIEAKPPQWAANYIETIERGDVTGMSFGFVAGADEWDHKKNIRTLTEIEELPEVSIVPFPAYPATDVSVALRSMKTSLEHTHSRLNRASLGHTHSRLTGHIVKQAKRRIKQLLEGEDDT